MSSLLNKLLAHYYAHMLDWYQDAFPASLLQQQRPPKNTQAFALYVRLLRGHVGILKALRAKDIEFMKLVQLYRLRKLLTAARQTVWWPEYFRQNSFDPTKIKTVEDLHHLPPINKQPLREVPVQHLLTIPKDDKRIAWRRSGGSTTGTPFFWAHHEASVLISMLGIFIEEMEDLGFSFKKVEKKNFYMQFNFAHRPSATGSRFFLKEDYFLSVTQNNYESELHRLVSMMDEYTVVRTSPTELIFLVEELRVANLRPRLAFCLMSGEPLDQNIRKVASDYFNCPILIHYGTQETAPVAMECREFAGQYHVLSERAIIEILDDTGAVVEDGEVGNVTVTSFDNQIMPTLRYQPGDIGVMRPASCSCGRKSPLLEIKSRTTMFILMDNNVKKPVSHAFSVFYTEPFIHAVRRFRLNQSEIGSVVVQVELRNGYDDVSVLSNLETELTRLYPGLKVEAEAVPSIEQKSPKFRPFISTVL